MPTATKQHPGSISAALSAPMPGAATFRPKVTVAPWEPTPSVPTPAAEPRLLTVTEAAQVVPLSTKQLYRVAEREDGPFRKVEGRLMAYEDALHRWIKSHPTGSKAAESPAAEGDSLADRVRRRRKGGAA